ncbi:MAG TPA: hypothetical protein VET27_11620 [Mycobacterium sp.]|nr:hypothetical protein [Mycobacterium sp.]
MKNFGFAALVVGVLSAAVAGHPAHVLGSLAVESATTVTADTSHHVWLDQISPVVNVPRVDTTVHPSR